MRGGRQENPQGRRDTLGPGDGQCSVPEEAAGSIGRMRGHYRTKRAEEAARRSESELRDLIENVPAMVFIALPGPSNAFVSRGWREYTGLSAEDTKELVGKAWSTRKTWNDTWRIGESARRTASRSKMRHVSARGGR